MQSFLQKVCSLHRNNLFCSHNSYPLLIYITGGEWSQVTAVTMWPPEIVDRINYFTILFALGLSRRNKAPFWEFTGTKVGVYCLQSSGLLSLKFRRLYSADNQIDTNDCFNDWRFVNFIYNRKAKKSKRSHGHSCDHVTAWSRIVLISYACLLFVHGIWPFDEPNRYHEHQ